MRVLALDPGERVGWARADVAEDGSWSELRHGITPLRDMALAIDRALRYEIVPPSYAEPSLLGDEPAYDLIVCESWRLYPAQARAMVGSSFPAVQFIGMVRLCCWISGTQLVMQGADTKKTADKALSATWPDLYNKVVAPRAHDDAHDMDAIRHLFVWTFKNRLSVGAKQPQEAAT